MLRREFLTSLFGGVAAAPLGARTERWEVDAAGEERDADLRFGAALHALAVENEQFLAQIKRKDEELARANEHINHVTRLVHEMNCTTALIITAADFILSDPAAATTRADAECIARSCRRVGEHIREVFQRHFRWKGIAVNS